MQETGTDGGFQRAQRRTVTQPWCEELCSGGGDAQRSLKCSKARKDAWEEDTQAEDAP